MGRGGAVHSMTHWLGGRGPLKGISGIYIYILNKSYKYPFSIFYVILELDGPSGVQTTPASISTSRKPNSESSIFAKCHAHPLNEFSQLRASKPKHGHANSIRYSPCTEQNRGPPSPRGLKRIRIYSRVGMVVAHPCWALGVQTFGKALI